MPRINVPPTMLADQGGDNVNWQGDPPIRAGEVKGRTGTRGCYVEGRRGESFLMRGRGTRPFRFCMYAGRLIAPALNLGPEWNLCHEADHLLSHHHLRQSTPTRNEMGWRDLLRVPKKHRRARSEVRSEVEYLKDTSDVDLVGSRPTESTPDLRIGSSTLPTPSPLTSRNQNSNGTRAIISRTIHLTALFSFNKDPHSVSDQILSIPGRGQSDGNHPKPPGHTVDPKATSEGKSNWSSTAYSTTKLAINLVKESSDAFPPLKSVTGGLSAILNHCDVHNIPVMLPAHYAYSCPSKQLPVGKQLNP